MTSTPSLLALVVIGAAAFLYGVTRPDPANAWGMYLINLLFWSSFAIAGPAVASMMQLTQARWSPTVKRIALSTGGFLPYSLLGFVLLFAGRAVLYPWVTKPELVTKKAVWLNVPFMSARIGIGVLLLYWVAMTFTRAVFAQDRDAVQSEPTQRRLDRLATTLLFLFMIVLSLWGFDLLMSLDPVWYSGLFGGYYVVTTLYPGFALVCFLTIRANARGFTKVSAHSIQDVAKLFFAMCVFWMYFFFSQYLVIWYGNVPVETRFFLRRFFDDPWRTLAWVILIVGALIPFCYLLKRLTGRPPTSHTPLLVVIVMCWVAIFLERVMVVFPSMSRSNDWPVGLVGVLITAGFFGLFVLSRNRFLARYGSQIPQTH